MFGSIQLSPATLVRVATDLSNLAAANKKSATPDGMTDFWSC